MPLGKEYGEPPDEDFKEGFRVLVMVDGVIHEFSSTAAGAWNSLVSVWQDQISDHPGEVPEVGLHDIVERKYAGGTSWEPSFKILRWVPRPAELEEGEPPQQSPRKQPARAGDDLDDSVPF